MAVLGYLLLQNIHAQENWNLLNIEYPIPLLQIIYNLFENGYPVHIPLIDIVTFNLTHTILNRTLCFPNQNKVWLTWHSTPHTPCFRSSPSPWGGSLSPGGGSSGWSGCYGRCNTSCLSLSSPVTSPGGGETHQHMLKKRLQWIKARYVKMKCQETKCLSQTILDYCYPLQIFSYEEKPHKYKIFNLFLNHLSIYMNETWKVFLMTKQWEHCYFHVSCTCHIVYVVIESLCIRCLTSLSPFLYTTHTAD